MAAGTFITVATRQHGATQTGIQTDTDTDTHARTNTHAHTHTPHPHTATHTHTHTHTHTEEEVNTMPDASYHQGWLPLGRGGVVV